MQGPEILYVNRRSKSMQISVKSKSTTWPSVEISIQLLAIVNELLEFYAEMDHKHILWEAFLTS